VSENASRDALNGRIGLFGRAIRPARSTTRGPETEIAWKAAFGCFSVTGGKPNGECRLRRHHIASLLSSAIDNAVAPMVLSTLEGVAAFLRTGSSAGSHSWRPSRTSIISLAQDLGRLQAADLGGMLAHQVQHGRDQLTTQGQL
jgi:hypothetical protein